MCTQSECVFKVNATSGRCCDHYEGSKVNRLPRSCRSAHPARPSPGGETLWIATPIAVEVTCEHAARALEAVDPIHVGELGTPARKVTAEDVALVAARYGATHFRVVTAGDDARIDVVLYRVERRRWNALPEQLRPLEPARDESDIHASL